MTDPELLIGLTSVWSAFSDSELP